MRATTRLTRAATVLAVIGWIVAVTASAGAIAIRLMDPVPMIANTFGFGDVSLVGFVLQGISFASVGALLMVRRPANAVGWVMSVVGACQALAALMAAITASAAAAGPEAVDTMRLAAWFAVVAATLGGVFFVLGIIFPTGHGPTPAWDRALVIGAVIAPVVLIVGFFVRPGPLQLFPSIDNPFGFGPDLRPIFGPSPSQVIAAGTALFAPVIFAAMVIRYRRADAIERLQLRWFISSLAAMVGGIFLAAVTAGLTDRPPEFGLAVFGVFGALVPVAIGIAILRYHLYDIDRLISRTIAWAIVSGLLLAAFVGLVIGLQAVLAEVTTGDSVAVAVSTLIAAVLFGPLRARVQRAVDLRFDRARYDGERLIADFGERLRDEVELTTIERDVLATVDAAVRPSRVALGLRRRPEVAR